ncbi:STAS domain-containing protein [Allostreptomyces psammosilenae]|uniref:Anti-sigma factor antagonist n=1 Tax=Allostreptomyces psammosilenae TaxID=1892865 RepID=A0A852ZY08_9ACTN|nr:STAS domain-containing protein [Allostreptomyces psammosilenae]NYI06935.1 anti-sigma B factor antagonist [Allostreptomyces psammosilenae]
MNQIQDPTQLSPSVAAVRQEAGHAVVELRGDIDLDAGPLLRRTLLELVAAGADRLVLDLSGVGFIDSTGIGILVTIVNKVHNHFDGVVKLAAPSENVTRLLAMTGLGEVFVVYPSVDAAVGRPTLSEAV